MAPGANQTCNETSADSFSSSKAPTEPMPPGGIASDSTGTPPLANGSTTNESVTDSPLEGDAAVTEGIMTRTARAVAGAMFGGAEAPPPPPLSTPLMLSTPPRPASPGVYGTPPLPSCTEPREISAEQPAFSAPPPSPPPVAPQLGPVSLQAPPTAVQSPVPQSMDPEKAPKGPQAAQEAPIAVLPSPLPLLPAPILAKVVEHTQDSAKASARDKENARGENGSLASPTPADATASELASKPAAATAAPIATSPAPTPTSELAQAADSPAPTAASPTASPTASLTAASTGSPPATPAASAASPGSAPTAAPAAVANSTGEAGTSGASVNATASASSGGGVNAAGTPASTTTASATQTASSAASPSTAQTASPASTPTAAPAAAAAPSRPVPPAIANDPNNIFGALTQRMGALELNQTLINTWISLWEGKVSSKMKNLSATQDEAGRKLLATQTNVNATQTALSELTAVLGVERLEQVSRDTADAVKLRENVSSIEAQLLHLLARHEESLARSQLELAELRISHRIELICCMLLSLAVSWLVTAQCIVVKGTSNSSGILRGRSSATGIKRPASSSLDAHLERDSLDAELQGIGCDGGVPTIVEDLACPEPRSPLAYALAQSKKRASQSRAVPLSRRSRSTSSSSCVPPSRSTGSLPSLRPLALPDGKSTDVAALKPQVSSPCSKVLPEATPTPSLSSSPDSSDT